MGRKIVYSPKEKGKIEYPTFLTKCVILFCADLFKMLSIVIVTSKLTLNAKYIASKRPVVEQRHEV